MVTVFRLPLKKKLKPLWNKDIQALFYQWLPRVGTKAFPALPPHPPRPDSLSHHKGTAAGKIVDPARSFPYLHTDLAIFVHYFLLMRIPYSGAPFVNSFFLFFVSKRGLECIVGVLKAFFWGPSWPRLFIAGGRNSLLAVSCPCSICSLTNHEDVRHPASRRAGVTTRHHGSPPSQLAVYVAVT